MEVRNFYRKASVLNELRGNCAIVLHMKFFLFASLILPVAGFSQIRWKNVDSLYQPLPKSVHVYFTDEQVDNAKFRAFYLVADLTNQRLDFTTDTSYNRRLTPLQFYEKNNKPLVVVNGTFFSFETNQNLNLVMKDGSLISYNVHSIPGRGKDSLTYRHPFGSAIGISKERKADVAWLITDSFFKQPFVLQTPVEAFKDSMQAIPLPKLLAFVYQSSTSTPENQKSWNMQTAIGGGPVLVQNGNIKITNEEERKFHGKAINDKHPRTAMGYTADNKLIILVIEGRNPEAGGASLIREAQILKDLGCVEALNLDGGGSSCLLINGQETIRPSDKGNQRPVPAVFIIRGKI